MFRSVLFNLYCLVEYYDYHESKQYPILLITIVLSLIRGFGYFKVFSPTRWLMHLVIQVCFQLWSFVLITVYTIVSFAIIYNIIAKNYSNVDENFAQQE